MKNKDRELKRFLENGQTRSQSKTKKAQKVNQMCTLGLVQETIPLILEPVEAPKETSLRELGPFPGIGFIQPPQQVPQADGWYNETEP
jgi:hypothetical protein